MKDQGDTEKKYDICICVTGVAEGDSKSGKEMVEKFQNWWGKKNQAMVAEHSTD